MKKPFVFIALFVIVFSSNLNASCISEEMKKQAMDMEAYTPPEIWKVLANTDVPAKLKAFALNKEQWKKFEKENQNFANQFNNQIRTDADRRAFITETERRLTPKKGQGMGVWEMLLMQAALRCVKRGEKL